MNIAFVYDAVYPWEKGGAQKRIWELARRLADDHEVHIYGMHYWDGPETIEKDGVTLRGICEPYDLYADGRRSIPQALRFAKAVTRPLLNEDFDIIDCQQFPYFPIFATKTHELLNNSTLVVTWYEVWDDYWLDYLGTKGWAGRTVERVTSKLPNTIIPISEYIADDLRAIGRTDGLHVVENGVDYEHLQGIDPADEDWDVVYLGRLSEHKNVDVLLDAVAALAEDGLVVDTCIIGDGPERDQLEAHAKHLEVTDHVEFKGFVEADEDVIATLRASTLFVLPSEREGFPNTILEANACGVPSIVVDHPENGSTAVVEDAVTGFITDLSADAIANRIRTVLTDEELRQELSTNAREYGREHDWSVIVEELEEVYTNALAENH